MTVGQLALLAFKVVAIWTLVSFAFGSLVCWLISRGKMDSHRRDDGAGSDQSVFLRGGGEQGSNIDHSTLV